MTFSRDMRLFQGAQSMRSLLSSICRQVNCFQELRRPASIDVKEQSIEEVWRFWLRRESMRRLAYTLWVSVSTITGLGSWFIRLKPVSQLIDSQYLLFFDLPPVIPMKLLRVRLPCYESLWYAPTATAWLKCHQQKGGLFCWQVPFIADILVRHLRPTQHSRRAGPSLSIACPQ